MMYINAMPDFYIRRLILASGIHYHMKIRPAFSADSTGEVWVGSKHTSFNTIHLLHERLSVNTPVNRARVKRFTKPWKNGPFQN